MRIQSQPELRCETVSNQTEKQVMVAPDCKVEEAEGSGFSIVFICREDKIHLLQLNRLA